jgi:hypothetical protein
MSIHTLPDGFVNGYYLQEASQYRWVGYTVDYLNRRTRSAWTLGFVMHTPQRYVEEYNVLHNGVMCNRRQVVAYAGVMSVDGILMRLRSSNPAYVDNEMSVSNNNSFGLQVCVDQWIHCI